MLRKFHILLPYCFIYLESVICVFNGVVMESDLHENESAVQIYSSYKHTTLSSS